MKTKLLKLLPATACAIFVICSLRISAYAGNKEYVITFRAGNVGSFNDSISEYIDDCEASGYDVELTKHGAIKIHAIQGMAYPSAPTAQYIDIDGDYFVLPTEKWGPSEMIVDDNAEYVVDYGRLIGGVEYTVRYIDKTTKENVNLVSVIKGNVGEKVSVEAPSNITISESTRYFLSGDKKKEIVLDKDASKNEIVFEYNREETRTEVETVITVIPGETITNIQYIETQGTAPAVTVPGQGGAGQGAEAATTIPEEETPLEETVEPENETVEEVEIPEEETAMDSGRDLVKEQPSIESDEVFIEEPKVPASNWVGMPPAYIAAIGASAVGLIVSAMIWAAKRKKR